MRPRPTFPQLLVLPIALSMVAGCASTQKSSGGDDGPAPTDAAAYYPLEQGWKWAYDVIQDGQQILATYGVQSNDGVKVSVRAGSETWIYGIKEDGITRNDGSARGDYMLRNPLELDAQWKLRMGQARVIGFGETVEVAAGVFNNCIIVEETRIEPDRSSRTTYAPGVGPILIEYQAAEALAGEIRGLRAELRGFTKPGLDAFGDPL